MFINPIDRFALQQKMLMFYIYVIYLSRLETMRDSAHLRIATALDVRFKNLKCLPKERRKETWQLIERLMEDTDVGEQPPSKKRRTCQEPNSSIFSLEDSDSETDDDVQVGEDSKHE